MELARPLSFSPNQGLLLTLGTLPWEEILQCCYLHLAPCGWSSRTKSPACLFSHRLVCKNTAGSSWWQLLLSLGLCEGQLLPALTPDWGGPSLRRAQEPFSIAPLLWVLRRSYAGGKYTSIHFLGKTVPGLYSVGIGFFFSQNHIFGVGERAWLFVRFLVSTKRMAMFLVDT